jgi:hypothetical protein
MARMTVVALEGREQEGTRKLVRRDCGKLRLSVSATSFRTKAKVILRTILTLSQVRSVNHEHT